MVLFEEFESSAEEVTEGWGFELVAAAVCDGEFAESVEGVDVEGESGEDGGAACVVVGVYVLCHSIFWVSKK